MKLQNFCGVNLLVRLKNPTFWIQMILAIFIPILTYFGATWDQMTSWSKLFNLLFCAIKNPVVVVSIVISVWNAIIDPTTSGMHDSKRALSYEEPIKEE